MTTKAFIDAIKSGDLDTVKKMHAQKHGMGLMDKEMDYAFLIAIEHGQIEVCELLLEHEGAVKMLKDHWVFLFTVAAEHKHINIGIMLVVAIAEMDGYYRNWIEEVESGLDGLKGKENAEFTDAAKTAVAAKRHEFTMRLHDAIMNDDGDKVFYFIEKGAHMDEIGKDGDYPVHMAVRNGAKSAIRALYECNADVSVESEKDGKTIRDIVHEKGVKKEMPGVITEIVIQAIKADDFDAVENLFDADVDERIIAVEGRSALVIAAEHGQFYICDLLLLERDDVIERIIEGDGARALSAAASSGHAGIGKAIITRMAEWVDGWEEQVEAVLEESQYKASGKFIAAMEKAVETVKDDLAERMVNFIIQDDENAVAEIVKKGISLHEVIKDGDYPAHIAARHRSIDVLSAFCLSDVDLTVKSEKDDKTVEDILADEGVRRGALDKTTAAAFVAIKSGDVTTVRKLFNREVYEDIYDLVGNILLAAVEKGQTKLCSLFLEYDFVINGAEKDLAAAMGIAAERGHAEIGALLVTPLSDLADEFGDWEQVVGSAIRKSRVKGHRQFVAAVKKAAKARKMVYTLEMVDAIKDDDVEGIVHALEKGALIDHPCENGEYAEQVAARHNAKHALAFFQSGVQAEGIEQGKEKPAKAVRKAVKKEEIDDIEEDDVYMAGFNPA